MKGVNADETTGIAIVRRAIEEPLRQIVANCRWRRIMWLFKKLKKAKETMVTMHELRFMRLD